jgi:hypothetical protein
LEADFGAPESFIHHALLELGVAVQSAPWLAPYVVSVDGRMTKWCDRCALPRPAPARLAPRTVPRVPTVGHVPTVGRHVTRARLTRLNTSRRPSPHHCRSYRKLGVSYFTQFSGSSACSRHFLDLAWQGGGEVPSCTDGSARASHSGRASTRIRPAPGRTSAGGAAPPCTRANGCCRRHPRSCDE